ncbi:MAG TPA: glutaminase A [Myxococcota bacterium]
MLRSPIERYLSALHERYLALEDGAVATYIPELGKADPRSFGICVATIDGHVYEVGDARLPFTLQSISKPFVYGLALEDRGKAAVLERIGVEPTGEAFNEISLEAQSGRPRNPLINAGAITATSLVAGRSPADRWARILALFELYAGRGLALDEAVFASERETGHRNRAIGHMLRNFGILEEPPDAPLELYFRQCSIAVTCRDLALMAATLASGGVNPLTRQRALGAENVDEVLSVMTSCGMYDYAGEWLFRVGFPAKSGVSGGILAVLPGQLGIGVFSPPLDARGNSVRGVAVCSALSHELELHSLRAARTALSTLRARFDLRRASSKRVRTAAERDALASAAQRAAVYQLQGDLSFAGTERVVRKLQAESGALRCFVFDFECVHEISDAAARILCELLAGAARAQLAFSCVGLARHARLARSLGEAVASGALPHFAQHADLDAALEWCEQRLLGEGASAPQTELALEQHEALAGLEPEDLRAVVALAERRELAPRQIVVREGDAAEEVFLLAAGRLSVLASSADGQLHRLATLSPGMSFGESALVQRGTRTALVRADEPSVCWALRRDALEGASRERPRLMTALLGSLLRSAIAVSARLTRELAAARSVQGFPPE